MFGIHRATLGAKLFILSMQVLYLVIAGYWLMVTPLNSWARGLMVLALLVVCGRLTGMMFIWLPRGIGWTEAIGNSLAFALYYLGFPALLIWQATPRWGMVVIGSGCFIIGSVVNTTAELLRKPFKANPKNRGRLYTGGLFHYAIHINYFGDVLWVLGLALMTSNWWALLIPLGLLAMFVLTYIPQADAYLAKRYGADFQHYQATTKELIPWIW